MSVAVIFKDFVSNLRITNHVTIEDRYAGITRSLNKYFRTLDSTANNLQVGSYGRWTAIKGVSDLDMLYIMPDSDWDRYNKEGGQSKLLSDTKAAIQERYSTTTITVDRLVVCVKFQNFNVEVQPVFKQDDGSFKYPDTYNGGSWKITKPKDEIKATSDVDDDQNGNLRRLCKMLRAWKNKHGIGIGGLLIDTLAHNFLTQTDDYAEKSFASYDCMVRDFFYYASNLPQQERYAALGSRQHVKVKQKFQKPAKRAYELSLKAIEAAGKENEGERWKKVFGRDFPTTRTAARAAMESLAKSLYTFRDTEEFIEDLAPIDVRYPLVLDCDVEQKGFRERLLSDLIALGLPLQARKTLKFKIARNDVPKPYTVKWKVLNIGQEAEKRDCIRGYITADLGHETIQESTSFKGDHLVECYILKDGVVAARSEITVPISESI
ncbi:MULTISPECIES: SMODS domain-containing nucleotidyltransferase [unclassified Pseudomonas]|uniref:SMODS domain-containing nucleotidyltransferase n=1 Tax=unclassified Pseudomonas TaxID=196821 RepID=UPI002B23E9BD|nr:MULTISPECIES: nucleotidyltransferase [unclassified Pseudomonas]MEA9979692.1 nucleotidyltransferase [Pseudomonas sp. RTS4]MEB0196460.1 nucleotidyltransferase [Pseudomonas sp. 5S4]MEB0247557.1 nucleotidyltransferase [Pseudomonas sp. 10S5]